MARQKMYRKLDKWLEKTENNWWLFTKDSFNLPYMGDKELYEFVLELGLFDKKDFPYKKFKELSVEIGNIMAMAFYETGALPFLGLGTIELRKKSVSKIYRSGRKVMVTRSLINWKETRKKMEELYPDRTKDEWKKVPLIEYPLVFYESSDIFRIVFVATYTQISSLGVFNYRASRLLRSLTKEAIKSKKKIAREGLFLSCRGGARRPVEMWQGFVHRFDGGTPTILKQSIRDVNYDYNYRKYKKSRGL